MADESKDDEPKLTILVLGRSEAIVRELNDDDVWSSSFLAKGADSGRDCKGEGILFYPMGNLSNADEFEEEMDFFDKDVSSLGGIDNMCVFVWVELSDAHVESELIKRTRLKERGCVWEFGAGSYSVILPRMNQFLKDNFHQTHLKPAKRD